MVSGPAGNIQPTVSECNTPAQFSMYRSPNGVAGICLMSHSEISMADAQDPGHIKSGKARAGVEEYSRGVRKRLRFSRVFSALATNFPKGCSGQAAFRGAECSGRIDFSSSGSSVKRRLWTVSPDDARSAYAPRRDLCSIPFQRLHLSQASSRATARSVLLVPRSRVRANSFRRMPRSYSAQR